MFWFSGSINEAINKSKSERKLFVVFICGNDDISGQMDRLYDSLSTKLSDMPLVAIRLESQSDNCKLFSQIYPVIVIPSTYFIDTNGVAIEIIGGSVEDKNVLFDKINKTIEVFTKSLTSTESEAPIESINTSSASNRESSQPNPNPNIPVTAVPSLAASVSDSSPVPSSSTASEGPTIDAKVERANQLIEAIRQKKSKEEAEKEKLDEMERRKGMKEMQKSKRLREDKDVQEVVEEREREKRAAKLAKDRVLAQIAADREERKARQMVFTESKTKEPIDAKKSTDKEEQEVRQRMYTKTRIQFRLPDGSTDSNSFETNDSLEIVRQYVVSNLNIRSFILSTTFPRREFEANDYNQTLQELSLSPSAVLLVIPKTGINSSRALSSPSILWQTLTYLFTPFLMIWNFMSSFFGTNSNETNESTERSKKKKFYNRDGNIARMRGPNDSDDDNNTWNGNSTQQM